MAATAKDQAQPDAGHENRVHPAAGPSPATEVAPGKDTLQTVQREVERLEERLSDLEHRGESSPAGVYSDPDCVPAGGNLQEILPRIKDLAQCVGGMKNLAQIVTTLAESKG
jgi:hypothetical protein